MDATSSTLVARAAELALLESATAELLAGRGRSVLIEGEPGIGKSALLARALDGVDPARCEILRGACDDLWGRFPLAIMARILGVETGATLVSAPPADQARTISTADPLFAEVERLLAAVDAKSAERPVVLAVDDLQWADEASLLLWRRLSRATSQVPLLLVGTCRPFPRSEGLDVLRRELRGDGGVLLTLESLPEEGVSALVEQLAGGRPGRRLATRLEAARGNPLYLRELIDALGRVDAVRVADGVADLQPANPAAARPGDAGAAADAAVLSLAGAIADRLDFLTRDTRAVLRAAALLGPEFTVTDLAGVLERPPSKLSAQIEEATESGVLEPAGARLRFRHGLIRQSLHEATPAALRSALVRQAAQAMVKAGAPTERVAELILAEPEAADGWELDWLVANLAALCGRAPAVAADLLAHSLGHTPVDHPDRGVLEDEYAEAAFVLDRNEDVERITTGVLGHGATPERIGRASWVLGRTYIRTGRCARAIELVTDPATLDRLDEAWQARMHALHALALAVIGQDAEAEQIAEKGLALAEQVEDRMAAAYNLHVLSLTANVLRDAASMVDRIEQALAVVGDDPRLSDLRVTLLCNKVSHASGLDRVEDTEEAIREVRTLAERSGLPRMGMALSVAAAVEYSTGRWVEAQADLEAISELPDVNHFMTMVQHSVLALIAVRRGERRPATRHLAVLRGRTEAGDRRTRRPTWLPLAEAELAEQEGRPQQAIEALTSVLRDESEAKESGSFLVWLPVLVRMALDADQPELARETSAITAQIAERYQTPRGLAVAQWCAGQVEDDPARLRAAVEYHRSSGRRAEEGQVLEALAVSLARTGQPDAAREALTEALAVASDLGADWDARRAAARLRRHGVQLAPRSVRRRERTGWKALTDTEVRVARLIAEGRTNTEIAAGMVLSRRTVETHVSHILAKLQVGSRREVGEVARAAI